MVFLRVVFLLCLYPTSSASRYGRRSYERVFCWRRNTRKPFRCILICICARALWEDTHNAATNAPGDPSDKLLVGKLLFSNPCSGISSRGALLLGPPCADAAPRLPPYTYTQTHMLHIYMYVHVCTHTYIHTYIHACWMDPTSVCVFTHTHTHAHTHTGSMSNIHRSIQADPVPEFAPREQVGFQGLGWG